MRNRTTQTLIVEGHKYTREELLHLSAHAEEETSPFFLDLCRFLTEWFDESPTLNVQTSGSTGTPKIIQVNKEKMMQSARLTCEFLDLKEGDTALLCMPLAYIAGKMVVIRALVGGLNLLLRTPSGHPLADLESPIRFAAMIPLQVFNSLQLPCEKERLSRIEILIIGGGAIDAALEREIAVLPGEVYSTYGMTETLSHIALRRLNGPLASPYYQPFSSVKLSLSTDHTLVIDAPLVCDEVLVTNDVVQFREDGSFIILGRKDNIINTGGIKIQMERVEEFLKPFLKVPFAITSVSDPRLGQAVVLLVERGKDEDELLKEILSKLPKYEQPKHLWLIDRLPVTGSGKIDRANCRLLAEELMKLNEENKYL